MTGTFEPGARSSEPKDRSRLSRGLANTIPIVLVGSMAMSLNVTGPIQVDARRADKTKSTPSELTKTIRGAFTAAARAATNPAAAPVSEAATAVAATAPATYTVAAGDTVSSIAGRFGLATASVLALNGLGWKSLIFAGQQLKLTSSGAIPVVSAPRTPAPSATTRYSIQKGDTIGGIAAKFGLSTQTLLSANGLGWSSIIYAGHTLAIPSSSAVAAVSTVAITPIVESHATTAVTPKPATPQNYVIAVGDTVSSIAAKFGVTAQAILTANGLNWSSIIYTGRAITIPSIAAAAAQSSSTPIPQSPSTIVPLTAEMMTNARTIVKVGRSLGVPNYGLVIALAAAAQESGLKNIDYGDRDSLGLFQQRPSAGWGTPAQILDPTYASRLFFGGPSNPNTGVTRGLLDIPGWQSMSVTNAAQAVQLSGFPTAYAKWEASARSWVSALT
ncbi:MAG: LysM peptidoglycan-binding protein [Microbacteriaceae bacterium]|jgi:LysM repeat protein|nr:LysM peptidoglycan-binding protein [Microbacteriaceae bacterium]